MNTPHQPKSASASPRYSGHPILQSAAPDTLRRLPVVPAPAQGEAFTSWVDRTASTLGVSPGIAARALGLEYRTNDRTPVFFGIKITPASLNGLRKTTGLAADVLEKMHLSRYDGIILNFEKLTLEYDKPLAGALGKQWLVLSGSRACPHCLARSDAWPLWWRLGIAAICPLHRCLLIDTCPACGIALRRGSTLMPRALLRRTHTAFDVQECGNRQPNPDRPRKPDVCQQRIVDIPTQPVPDALVAIQQRALAIADGGAAQLVGKPVTGAEWFAAVRFIAAVARLVVHDDELAALPNAAAEALATVRDTRHEKRAKYARGGVPDPSAGPATAAEAAALLALAAPIVDAPDRTSGPAYLATWAKSLNEDRVNRYHKLDPLRHLQRPLVMDEMMAATIPHAYRYVSVKGTESKSALEFWHIPQRIDAGDYLDLMAVHLPRIKAATGRPIVSLALARLAGADTWAQASQALGLPTQSPTTYKRIAHRTADLEAFWEATRALADRMKARGLVDYEARRMVLSSLREVPHRVLVPILNPVGQLVTWQRQRHAAAWLWEQLTGGLAEDSPTYADGWEGIKEASIIFARRRFHAELPAEAGNALTAWGMEWLASNGVK
ncbi:TniQ family protein [Streptomyces sioyaensis]|uniref:TniQ family protein n=1 Tax=Streptomyces sioyaensis TaxID=67364 RepID=UPI0037CE13B1